MEMQWAEVAVLGCRSEKSRPPPNQYRTAVSSCCTVYRRRRATFVEVFKAQYKEIVSPSTLRRPFTSINPRSPALISPKEKRAPAPGAGPAHLTSPRLHATRRDLSQSQRTFPKIDRPTLLLPPLRCEPLSSASCPHVTSQPPNQLCARDTPSITAFHDFTRRRLLAC